MPLIRALVAGVLASALLLACTDDSAPSGQVSSSTALPPTSTPTVTPEATATPTPGASPGATGSPQFQVGSLIEGFPDFPVPESATVTQSQSGDAGGGVTSYRANWTSTMSPREVGEFYEAALAEEPWSITQATVTDDSSLILFANAEDAGLGGALSVEAAEGGSSFTVVMGGQ
jgi:hypothetical protein